MIVACTFHASRFFLSGAMTGTGASEASVYLHYSRRVSKVLEIKGARGIS
jgi:hypothetical protein